MSAVEPVEEEHVVEFLFGLTIGIGIGVVVGAWLGAVLVSLGIWR